MGFLTALMASNKFGMFLKWGLPIIGVLLVVLYWYGRTEKIKELESTNLKLSTDMVAMELVYRGNLDRLKTAIDDQNVAIVKMAADAKAMEDKLKAEITKTREVNSVLDRDLKKNIMLLTKLGKMSCQEGINLVVDLALENKWPVDKGVK